MSAVTIGLDIGTTSVKALAVDGSGRVVASARHPHAVTREPRQLAHDADAAWRSGVEKALRRVAVGRDVRGVSVAAMVPSLTAVDAGGRPVAPGLLYGDHRGGEPTAGSPAESGEAAGFLAWLATEHPDAAGFWPAQAVANQALCGRAAIDYATAYCLTPLFDGSCWTTEADRLPDVVADVTEQIGRLGGDGAPVGAGTIDALAAQYVAGADRPGDVLVLLGSTLITWVVTSEWVERPGLWTIPHTAPGLSLVGGASNAGGLFVNWSTGLLQPGGPPPAPADVPVWLPYARGERTPLHDPSRRASIHDLHAGHGAEALRRAAYEASGFVVRHIVDLAALSARRIVAVGGGTHRREWVAALADTTGLPVDVGAVPDATALGTAFLARCVAGLETSPAEAGRWARTARRVEPDPAWLGHCTHRYQRFRALTDHTP
jgi:xylulokinase